MKAIHAMERRLQDLQRKFENKERLGKIVDVKYENERWMVKMNDGGDSNPSGQDSGGGGAGGGRTFKSDWLPWASFSHGTIKMSVPPKKGQQVLMRSVGGSPELATVEPHHYGPDTPSPHGKQDEMVQLIEDEDEEGGQGGGEGSSGGQGGEGGGEDKWNKWIRQSKDTHHLIIRKKEQSEDGGGSQGASSEGGGGSSGPDGMNEAGGQKQQKKRKIPEVDEDEGDDKTTQIKSTKDFILKTVGKNKSYQRMDNDKIHTRYGEKDEKGDMLFDEEQVKVQFKDKKSMIKWTEEDLTQQMGEDDKSKIKFTEDDITVTQGGDNASKTVWTKDKITVSQGDGTVITIEQDFIEVKGASDASIGVDGAWVHCTGGKVHLGVESAKGVAEAQVMTTAGPSSKVFAKV